MEYTSRILLSFALGCLLLFFGACDPLVTVPATDLPLNQFQEDMLNAVNRLRANGCNCGKEVMPPVDPLKYHQSLSLAAERHARDMARSVNLDHLGSDGSTPGIRIEEAGYQFSVASENIAFGYRELQAALKGWLESEEHCKNMMSPQITEMGAAKTELYWVQTFASPAD